MKSAQRFIPAAVNELQNHSHTQQGQPHHGREFNEQDAEIINNVFSALQGSFPAWKQAWPKKQNLDDARREWTKAFIEHEITSMEQIQNGLRQCRQHPSSWPPSPGVFLMWCKPVADTPESLGLPSVDKAYLLACEYAYPVFDHSRCIQVIYHAACETGLGFLRTDTQGKARQPFERHYQDAIQILANGGELRKLPPAPDRLLPRRTSSESRAAGQAFLASLKRKVGAA